jgi:type I restriction enzyme S subunit
MFFNLAFCLLVWQDKFGRTQKINPKLPFDLIDENIEVSFLPMKLVEEESNKIHLTEFRKYSEVKKGFTPMTDGDVIFAKITPCMENGKIAIVDSLRNKIGFGSTEFHVFRNLSAVLNRYLFYYFIQLKIRYEASQNMTGAVGQRRVPKKFLEDLSIPLPPLAEQHRIVAKIEELFSSLDNGIQNLKTAQQQLKIYRQAVLKWDFEGKLTNEKNDISQSQETNDLPEGWQWLKLEEVTECLDNKRRPINKEERQKRLGNIPYYGANGRTGWIDDFLFDEPLILVVEDETFVGRELPFSYRITGKTWVNNHAHILRPKENLHIDFLNYQLSYYPFLPLTTGTTGRKKLTKTALMNAPFKICSIEEQHQIVKEIESRLSICDKVEETIQTSLKKAEILRQSILKKAFSDQLVPQNPNDEPASLLLEKIQAKLAKNIPKSPRKSRKKDNLS